VAAKTTSTLNDVTAGRRTNRFRFSRFNCVRFKFTGAFPKSAPRMARCSFNIVADFPTVSSNIVHATCDPVKQLRFRAVFVFVFFEKYFLPYGHGPWNFRIFDVGKRGFAFFFFYTIRDDRFVESIIITIIFTFTNIKSTTKLPPQSSSVRHVNRLFPIV